MSMCTFVQIQSDAPIDPMDRSKTTPLHLAAENGHEQLLLLLLKHGANIAAEDAYGRNVMEIAILAHRRSVVRAILQHDDWRLAMRTTFTAKDRYGGHVPVTPLRLLVRVFPDLATSVLDQCVKLEKGGPGAEKEPAGPAEALAYLGSGAVVRMDYEFIDDAFSMERVEEEDGPSGKRGKKMELEPLYGTSIISFTCMASVVRLLPGGQQQQREEDGRALRPEWQGHHGQPPSHDHGRIEEGGKLL